MKKEITKLDELKEIQLKIMKMVHAFCVANKIRYYLAYGTLIGAVRHKGFIPWDDDIDIFMPRPDYKKFLDCFDEYGVKYGLKVCSYNTQIFYCRPMAKVIDLKTVLIEPEYKFDDQIGVFIDIWPLDGVSSDLKKQKKETSTLAIKRFLLYKKITKYKYLRGARNRLLAPLCNLFVNHKKMAYQLDNYLSNHDFDNSKYVVCPLFPKKIMLRDWFDRQELATFEDSCFCIPNGYDDILSLQYGDWKTPPPKEKQVPHHIINVWRK